jgi:hypothetical protein
LKKKVLQSTGYKSIEHYLTGYEKIIDQSALSNAIQLTKKHSLQLPTLDWDIMVQLSYP